MIDLAISEATETLLETFEEKGLPLQQKNEVAQTSYNYPGSNSGFQRLREESIVKQKQVEDLVKVEFCTENEIKRKEIAKNQILILEELSFRNKIDLPIQLKEMSKFLMQNV